MQHSVDSITAMHQKDPVTARLICLLAERTGLRPCVMSVCHCASACLVLNAPGGFGYDSGIALASKSRHCCDGFLLRPTQLGMPERCLSRGNNGS